MSELPEGVTRQEFDDLRVAVSELADALKAQRQAETPTERREAREEVREARADLNELAREMGVDPARLRDAAERAKRDEQKDRLRPIILEILDEELPEETEEAKPKPAAKQKPEKDKPEPATKEKPEQEKPEQKPEEPETDSGPRIEHWSERPLSEMIRR